MAWACASWSSVSVGASRGSRGRLWPRQRRRRRRPWFCLDEEVASMHKRENGEACWVPRVCSSQTGALAWSWEHGNACSIVHGGDEALLPWRIGLGGKRGAASLGEKLTRPRGTRWGIRRSRGGHGVGEFNNELHGGRRGLGDAYVCSGASSLLIWCSLGRRR